MEPPAMPVSVHSLFFGNAPNGVDISYLIAGFEKQKEPQEQKKTNSTTP